MYSKAAVSNHAECLQTHRVTYSNVWILYVCCCSSGLLDQGSEFFLHSVEALTSFLCGSEKGTGSWIPPLGSKFTILLFLTLRFA